MKSRLKSLDILLIFLAIVALSSSAYFNRSFEKPKMFISKQEASLNFNSSFLNFINLGLKRFISATLWVSTIIESDQEHYKNKDYNSWMFLRFNTIRNLDPLFYPTYSFGAPYLSIIKDDLPGATFLYTEGLKIYPNDFSLLRDAGFHFHFEVSDYPRAYEIYSRLKNFSKFNPVMANTLARLEAEKGNRESAFELLLDKYNEISDKSSLLAIKIYQHLYAIRAEIDLECLNNNLSGCHRQDLDGNEYVEKTKGRFESARPFEIFRIKKKK